MQIKFVLPVQAFSINRMNSRDMRYKTAAYKDWHTQAAYLLSKVDGLTSMAWLFAEDGELGEFSIEFTATYPPHIYRNKQGQISSKTVDCSNFEKCLLDVIFGDTMGVNDKHVTSLLSRKRADKVYGIEVMLTYHKP